MKGTLAAEVARPKRAAGSLQQPGERHDCLAPFYPKAMQHSTASQAGAEGVELPTCGFGDCSPSGATSIQRTDLRDDTDCA
jgi:hypothetical protein